MHRTIRDYIVGLNPPPQIISAHDVEHMYYNDPTEVLRIMHNQMSDMRFIMNMMLISRILPTIKPHIILLLLHMPTRVWYHEERESPTP